MLNASQKNRIVNSYARILADILNNDEKNDLLSALKEMIKDIDMSKFNINPIILQKYKIVIDTVNKAIDTKDNLQKFLSTILTRRYGYLLPDMLEVVERKMLKKRKKKIDVFSIEKLSNDICKDISEAVSREQTDNIEIVYHIDKSMKKGNIKFVANGNVCILSINNSLKKILDANFNSL